MPKNYATIRILFFLILRLFREAGYKYILLIGFIAFLKSLIEIVSIGLGISILFSNNSKHFQSLSIDISLQQAFFCLSLLILFRSLLQAYTSIKQQKLIFEFSDRLKKQVLSLVLQSSTSGLNQIGRGELMSLLMDEIDTSVGALNQAVSTIRHFISLILYAASILLINQENAVPLLLAFVSTSIAALLQRSESWSLGYTSTQLNSNLQRTVGDALHNLKAIRAAGAEDWIKKRFINDISNYRKVQQIMIKRQSLFTAWRDSLVILVMGGWLAWIRQDLDSSIIATTLLFGYRTATSFSSLIRSYRICLSWLPAYSELHRRRKLLTRSIALIPGKTDIEQRDEDLFTPIHWTSLIWSEDKTETSHLSIPLLLGQLTVVTGPSGIGKTTLIDQFCGLLSEHTSSWKVCSKVNNINLKGSIGAQIIRRHIAYSPQNSVLFEASLRENLTMGHNIESKSIKHWLSELQLLHIAERAHGLDEPLPLTQISFSGGEIHRLGLIRTWLRNQSIEILDEPTAFLDEESSVIVRSIISRRVKRKLILVSTHDPHIIKMADHVIALTDDYRPNAMSSYRDNQDDTSINQVYS